MATETSAQTEETIALAKILNRYLGKTMVGHINRWEEGDWDYLGKTNVIFEPILPNKPLIEVVIDGKPIAVTTVFFDRSNRLCLQLKNGNVLVLVERLCDYAIRTIQTVCRALFTANSSVRPVIPKIPAT